MSASVADESDALSDMRQTSREQQAGSMGPPSSFDNSGLDATPGSGQAPKTSFDASALGRGNPLQLVQPTPVSGLQANANPNANTMTGNMDQCTSPKTPVRCLTPPSTALSRAAERLALPIVAGLSDWMNRNPFHDMHSFNPHYMGVPEVSNEFNLLDDFLHSSMIDDGALLPETIGSQPDTTPGFLSNFNPNGNAIDQAGNDQLLSSSAMHPGSMLPPPLVTGGASSNADKARAISRPSSVLQIEKNMKLRKYYLEVADPEGNDPPAERMNKLLRAKVEAGELKPFNYVQGYTRLFSYLKDHVTPVSREKIRRQLDRFRPKFRDMVQALNDVDLVKVEMWLEETLLVYDRVFASMAVPACCWRRTGEIVRGNKEMAELIGVSVEQLRDVSRPHQTNRGGMQTTDPALGLLVMQGNVALHEILTEDSVVRYWEEFGTIAFDPDHDTLITATTLKSPDDTSNRPTLNCCFSFKIVRETHNM